MSSMNDDLFASASQSHVEGSAVRRFLPLAARMRPSDLDEYVGQAHLLAPGSSLRDSILSGHLHSMILWGPPGVGKTSLAKLLSSYSKAHFVELSAVLSGVKDIRAAVEQAKQHQQMYDQQTVLFVDEVHRFNKSQQDAFLPHIENGDILFIGATTENPSFELNSALLSRARVYTLKPLLESDLENLLTHALEQDEVLAPMRLSFDQPSKELLLAHADGDARRLLNTIEQCADRLRYDHGDQPKPLEFNIEMLQEVLKESFRRFDKQGEYFYDQISALHKSIRGSAPDAALYWFCRMLDGGCDPLYLARRLVRTASEDIGNADPRALEIALNAWQVQERLGSPEGELSLAQTVCYLASAPKSNAVYSAFNACMKFVKENPSDEVPMHLRNAPTELMKDLEYGKGYRYAHDEPNAFAAGEKYFPEGFGDPQFYQPSDRGLEQKISEKLRHLRELNEQSNMQRYNK